MSEVMIEVRDAIRTVSIDRPHVKNALTPSVVTQLTDAFLGAATDDVTRAVILTGRGGSFSSGLDLKAAISAPQELGTNAAEAGMKLFHGLVRAVRACPKPVVALVDGPAVGFGCDLALACDLRVATDRAYFQEKFVRIGLIPDGGGTFWLPRLVGLGKAAELVMLGDRLEADEALRLGVVNRVAPVEQAEGVAWELASRLAKGPPLALRHMKDCLTRSLARDLDAALDAECAAQLECLRSPDLMEGVMAFFEKREPRFKGGGT